MTNKTTILFIRSMYYYLTDNNIFYIWKNKTLQSARII